MMILIAGYESSGQIPSVYRRTCLQDSLPALAAPARDQWDRFTSSQTYRMTYVAVPLIAAGLIVAGEDSHFHSLRDNFLPSFRHHYDDYLQYAPAIAMLGLKIGGIQGRSSWGRMLVSDAFSASLMAIAVNTLKHTVKVMRPDGSNRHSFPSGHSATAFMTATMLHKEYGMTRSPWYSIGAYTAATLTGLSRQMNNKHWLSDVLVGAGIGILSTEVGYYLADLIFKGRDHVCATAGQTFRSGLQTFVFRALPGTQPDTGTLRAGRRPRSVAFDRRHGRRRRRLVHHAPHRDRRTRDHLQHAPVGR